MSNNNFAGISFGYDADKIFKERDATMCSRWKVSQVQFRDTSVNIHYNSDGNFIVEGKTPMGVQLVKYWAAAPPTYSLSFSGSGLPYPNEELALEKTPNKGVAEVKNGFFQFPLEYPNSYYDQVLRKYVPPQVKFCYVDRNGENRGDVYVANLGDGIPFRSLVDTKKRDWNAGPLFYCNNNLPVRSQYQILLDSGYPAVNKVPDNFWGLMPPH
jgi:hypothetical protein